MSDTQTTRKTGLCKAIEAAEYLNVDRKRIDAWLEDGTLPTVMVGTHRRTQWVAVYKLAGEVDETQDVN